MRRTQSLLFLNFRSSGEIKAANVRLPSDPRGGELFVLLAAREAQWATEKNVWILSLYEIVWVSW